MNSWVRKMECDKDCFTCPIGKWMACKRGEYIKGKDEWFKELKN